MNKKLITILIFLLISALSLFVFMKSVAKEEAGGGVVAPEFVPTATVNGLNIPLMIADDEEERRLGLSFRKGIDADRGMLFVMPEREFASFWMKDMQFPIDIIWIDGEKIVNISRELPPGGSEPKEVYSSEKPVDYVLEVNSGFAKKNGISIGDTIKLNLGTVVK